MRIPIARVTLALLGLLVTGPAGSADARQLQTTWTRYEQAQKAAEQAQYGILFYFPPLKGDRAEHTIFVSETVTVQSRKSPMVKVVEKHEHLRAMHRVDERLHTFVVTDWYGNPMTPKPFLARSADAKVPFDKILALLQKTPVFVAQTGQMLEKRLEKAEKSFERRRWRPALKEYLAVAEFRGHKACKQAAERIDAIVAEGRMELEKATKLAPEQRKKELRKIAKEFKGTALEKEAAQAIAEMDGTDDDGEH